MLMAAAKGNLDQVRGSLEVGDIVDYAPRNPLLAELVPDVTPRWHILETHPNQERTAAAHLVARRFGMFVPEIEEVVVRRGRKIDRTRLLFTGYIFVFVWDVLRHQDRIEAIPGVARIMFIDGQPAVISDGKIDEIRAVENAKRPLKSVLMDGVTGKKKKKERWRRKPKSKDEAEEECSNDIIAVRPWSAFQDGLLSLDSEGRNQTLLKALSLSS